VQLNALTMLYNKPPGVMPISRNSEIYIEYSPAIKEKIVEKRKLRKLWQINRCPVLKNKLNRAIKTLKDLLDIECNQEIQEYLNKLSATPKSIIPYGKSQKV